MSARDELAKVIAGTRFKAGTRRQQTTLEQADAILAAGYRKSRIIRTKEAIEALYDGTVIRDAAGDVAEKRGGVWCSYETAPMTNHQLAKYAPLDVLSEPTP